AKLARALRERQKKKVMVVSADVDRPAAIKQLETLAGEVGVTFFPSDLSQKPVDIVDAALREAKSRFMDVLIVDTAGRLHIDADMREEIKAVHAAAKPAETLSMVDAGVREANGGVMHVLIVDTAGRLHIDADMMKEIKAVHAAAKPAETLFVVDAMTGQDAANTAQAFNEALPLTGVILTKVDGDARGGAALSVRHIT